jgi:hypothetical protein
MSKINNLKTRMETMKVGGIPLLVKTPRERSDAFNIAGRFNWSILTRKRIGAVGYEIHRTK